MLDEGVLLSSCKISLKFCHSNKCLENYQIYSCQQDWKIENLAYKISKIQDTNRGSYNQGFLQPGVFQPGVLTTRGLTTRGSYNQGFLQPGILHQGSYNQGFLQPGVLTIRGSHEQGFLRPGVLQPGVLTTRVLTSGSS